MSATKHLQVSAVTILVSLLGKITSILEENLGKIEEVRGYVLVRESSALISLNFLRNLKSIKPKPKTSFLKNTVDLYNKKYVIVFSFVVENEIFNMSSKNKRRENYVIRGILLLFVIDIIINYI